MRPAHKQQTSSITALLAMARRPPKPGLDQNFELELRSGLTPLSDEQPAETEHLGRLRRNE